MDIDNHTSQPQNGLLRQVVFISIFFLISLFFGIYLLSQRVVFQGKASNKKEVSLENSYIFASPLSGCSDGQSRVRITVFVLDSTGLGVGGRMVKMDLSSEVIIDAVQESTDTFGRAFFDVASSTEQVVPIAGLIDGVRLPSTLSVSYAPSFCGAKR